MIHGSKLLTSEAKTCTGSVSSVAAEGPSRSVVIFAPAVQQIGENVLRKVHLT